jgi:hypothetical protein
LDHDYKTKVQFLSYSPETVNCPSQSYTREPGASFPAAAAWYNSYSVTLTIFNASIKNMVLISIMFVTAGFCFAAYGILKIPNLSLLSYSILFVMSNLNFWYPALSTQTLGMLTPSMQGFKEQWSLRGGTAHTRRVMRSLRVTGVTASGLWIMSMPMFMQNVDDSLNWIITVLLTY